MVPLYHGRCGGWQCVLLCYRWFRYITDAAEAFKSKEVKAGVKAAIDPPQTPPTPTVSLPDTAETTTEDEDRPEKEDRPISWDGPLWVVLASLKATHWSTNGDITNAHISATIQQILPKFSAVVSYVKQRQIGKFQLICTYVTMLSKYIIFQYAGRSRSKNKNNFCLIYLCICW